MKLKLSPEQFSREELARLKKVRVDQLKQADLNKHLFKFKEYKKRLAKDLIKARKSIEGEEEGSVEFYLCTEYNYLDKNDMPLLVVGNAANNWKNFLKDRIKTHKSTDATGSLRFDDSKKADTGISYLELTIERGKAKRKIIKKMMDKWLMPNGLEIKFAGVEEFDEDAPEVQQEANQPVQLNANDKLQAYFIAWKNGQYGEADAKKIRLQLKGNIDKWVAKYRALTPEQQTQHQAKYQQYGYILAQLEDQPEVQGSVGPSEIGPGGIVLNNGDGRTSLSHIDLNGLEAPSKMDKLKGTNYSKIYKALEGFNKEKDLERKRQLFSAVMGMIQKWVAHHKKDKVSTGKTKTQLANLENLYQRYLPFLEGAPQGEIKTPNKEIHKDTASLTGTKTLFDATAGTKESSERAKDVRDASIDDRALRLAHLLQRGKASNDDATFGAVIKWLTDNPEGELVDKYAAATLHVFKKQSNLRGDLLSVFKPQSLRSRYLFDMLEDKESPYACLAFALGLMGKTWFETIEREDAMGIVESKLSAAEINALWTATDPSTFEGAIAAFLNKSHKNMKAQIEQHAVLLTARKEGDFDTIKGANDAYLTSMIHRLRKEGRFGKKLNKEDFYANFQRWYDNADDDERKAMLEDSAFMKTLDSMSGTFSFSGIDKGDVAFIRAKLKAPKAPPKGKETNVIFDQLQAIAEKQATKNPIARWSQNKDIGQQFKDVLFDKAVKDPQKAVVAKFAEKELEEWEDLERKINNSDGDTTALEDQRAGIFNRAYSQLQELMETAGVHKDYQKEITETLNSNGAKGKIYQKLVKLAKSNFTYDFGEDVQVLIAELSPDSPELAAIKADEDLLRVLQARTLGQLGLEDNKKEWRTIVSQLSLTGDLAKTELSSEQHKAQKSESNFKRKHRKSRAKLQTKKELEAQKATIEAQKSKPEFWAARISTEYEKGYFSRDGHTILQTMFEAQRAGVRLTDVMAQLGDLDSDALDYIQTKDSYACKVIRDAANNGNRAITAREMLMESRESVNMKRKVKEEEVEKLVELLKPDELMKEMFDWEGLRKSIDQKKTLLDQLEAPNQTPEERKKREQELGDVEIRIRRFDILPSFLEDIDRVLPPQKAITVKAAMRDKVGEALTAEGENDTKKLLLEMKVLTDADIRLLGTALKAISNIEKEMQSETGLQWSSLSSRMLQRDIAVAKYLRKNWARSEHIGFMKGLLEPEELEEEKAKLVEGLNKSEEDLQEAIKKFEERKAQYDARMKQVINALAQAVFFTISMASGVGAAAGVVQLVWALASTFMQTTISEALNMVTAGDRSGGLSEKAENFLFKALADQAGAVTGLVGSNLAFAIDVKAIGTFSQAKVQGGGNALNAWENILRTPFLKTASGVMKETFEDIGKNFVKNLTDEKDSMFRDPIGDFKNWGEKTIKSLPKKYLQSLIMTTAATSVGELAGALGWDKSTLGYHNPDSVSKQNYTANGANRPFTPDDARLGFFNSDAKNFQDWFNGWGMFDASPTFGGATWKGGSDPIDGLTDVFSSAVKNLGDPKVLMALGNAAVWGKMDGSTHGIKQQLGGLVNKGFESLQNYKGVKLDDRQQKQLKAQMIEGFDKAMDQKTSEVLDALQKGYATNLQVDEEAIKAGELEPHVVLEIWETMDWIGDGGDAVRNTEFFDTVAEVLGIEGGEMRLLRRDPECRPFKTIRDYRAYYEEHRSAYTQVFANQPFVDHYLKVRTHNGDHPKQISYELDLDGQNYQITKDLEDDLNGIYTEWEELGNLNAQNRTLVFQ